MNAYYAERKGLITQQLKFSLEEFLNSFIQVYHYFHRKDALFGTDKQLIASLQRWLLFRTDR